MPGEDDPDHAAHLLPHQDRIPREDPEAADDQHHDAPETDIREQPVIGVDVRLRQRSDPVDDVEDPDDEEEIAAEGDPARCRRTLKGLLRLLLVVRTRHFRPLLVSMWTHRFLHGTPDTSRPTWRTILSGDGHDDHDLRRRAARRAPERPDDPRAGPCARSSSTGWPRPGSRASRRSASSTRRACRRWRAPRRSSPRSSACPGVVYAGLALNDKGYDRLRETGLDEVHFAFAASEEFNRRNAGATVEDSVQSAERIVAPRPRGRDPRDGDDRHRVRLPVRGRDRPGARARDRRPARRARAPTRSSSPTRSASACRGRSGTSSPRPSSSARRSASTSTTRARPASPTPTRRSRPARPSSTRRSAASAAAPSRRARPATSATEDLVYLLHGEGIETGIDLDALIGVAQWLEGVLGRPLEGQVYRAGTFAPVAG